MTTRLHGLVAATHTPFTPHGELALDVIEQQATLLAGDGVRTVFIGGTTGESHSLTDAERQSLAERWLQVTKGVPIRVIVHVGSNCLASAQALAEQAESLGAAAIAATAPTYFKPSSVETLVDCMQQITAAAPTTPFYYYDIPALTGVQVPVTEFLEQAPERLPTLAGVKFTNPDLMEFQRCLRADAGRWEIAWGCDEYMLAALALGAKAAVGSSYNFAASIYHRIIEAFEAGDLVTARDEQFRSVQLIERLGRDGYLAASRAVMEMRGVAIGPPRLPHLKLSPLQVNQLRQDLTDLGFFAWIDHS